MPKLSDKYVAGFFDSDGSVNMTWAKDCKRPQPCVSFSQKTSQDRVLHEIQREHGGSIRSYIINGSSYSKLTLYGQTAINALNRIKKHLVIKRHYAHVCIDMANKPVDDVDAAKRHLKEQRRVRSVPLPNFPPRKWLAGYFDGDGCLSVTSLSPGGNACAVAHIASSDFDTEGIETIYKVFGGRIHGMSSKPVKQWVLSLNPSNTAKFLGYFAKHLITKREQAELLLGCAAMGHFRDGRNIKAALKSLKAHDHRLSEPTVPAAAYLKDIRDIPAHERPKESYLPKHKRADAIVGTLAAA